MIPADLNEEQAARLESEIRRALDRRKLDLYKPYPKQIQFHNATSLFPDSIVSERLLMAGNQLGKCNTIASYIEHPDGSRSTCGELYRRGTPFQVWGWNGRQKVPTWAVEPIKKPITPCVRLWMADGRWWEGARQHWLLTQSGEYVFCDTLLASVPILRASTSESSQLTHDADVPRWKRIQRDCLVGCLQGLRFCDERLHAVISTVAAWIRQQADVPKYNYAAFETDVSPSIDTNNDRPLHDRLSNSYAQRRFSARCAASVYRVVRWCAQRTTRYIQDGSRRLLASLVPLLSTVEVPSDRSLLEASRHPFVIDGNKIIAYEVIPSQEVYDFTVPTTHNYVTAGLVHHNTMSAGAETAMHATGQYPAWFKGRRFTEPVKWWAGGKNGQSMRDTVQRTLLGEVNDLGTGMIPGHLILDVKKAVHGVPDQMETIFVKHVPTGGTSRITLKTYDQGRERWQGETLHGVWFDEEPPMDIYSEGKTRVQVKCGMVYLTFTPLLGMSEVVVRFMKEKPPGTVIISMTIHDVEHYSPEARAAIIAGYPAHERKARAMGVPIMGDGMVFPMEEDAIKEPVMVIPSFWPRLAGMDIGGWDHPTAVVWIAWDRDSDTIHVYDAYRANKQPAPVHASAIKARGVWIPVAWPHDALQHDKGAGEVIASQYRKEGVNMMLRHATHKPKPGDKEGEGGISLEAGVQEMLTRMQTGRFKVAENLFSWFEEFRMYHRKDGLIVKEDDDLMSATRIATMMVRYARVYSPPNLHPTIDAFRPSDPTMGVLG